MTVSDTFDAEAFLEWIEDESGAIPADELQQEWPNFPTQNLNGVTGPFIDGKFAYFVSDLRRAARGRTPRD